MGFVPKIGDIIGIAYCSKDMKKMTCPAFKISHYSPFPTLIDSSDLSVKITRTTLKNATFVPNESVDLITDIPSSNTATPKKRKRQN